MTQRRSSQGRRHPWEVILTDAAEADFQAIIEWTLEHFGEIQAQAYSETLSAAIEALMEGPDIVGAKLREDIAKGVHALHVARQGRRGSHFLMFRIASMKVRSRIEVLRMLHDSMDLPRHLSKSDPEK